MLESKDFLNILLSEYSYIKNELKTYIELFHRQTNFISIYIPILASFATIGFTWCIQAQTFPFPFAETYKLPWPYVGSVVFLYQVIALIAYILLAMVGCFFFASSINYIYLIEILARRAQSIEIAINKLAKSDIMVWEIAISPYLIRNRFHKGIWLSPSTLRIGWSFFILIVIFIMQLITANSIMGNELSIVFVIILSIFFVFFAIQAVAYIKIGIPEIIRIVEHECVSRQLK